MKARSRCPRSMSTFIAPDMKAMSPPGATGKKSSEIFVPKIADEGTDGTQ